MCDPYRHPMGYFGNGFVFVREPSWNALGDLPAEYGLTGYAHNTTPAWLLDIWKCSKHRHWPFTDPIRSTLELPAQPQLDVLDRICETLRRDRNAGAPFGQSSLRLASHLSRKLGAPVYFFAGDDDAIDMAAIADAGRLTRMEMRLGVYSVSFIDGRFRVTPRTFREDPDFKYDAGVLETAKPIEGVEVAAPVVVGGDTLYGAAVALWPRDAGDPAATLGIGTWDPYINIETDFKVVFSRPCPEAPLAEKPAPPRAAPTPLKKPWWKLW